ncbi:MAG: TonB family protein [Aphanocapsa feldmannii 277cV]|uniref:TonB family protein n=2 Tax=Aphanocapsa feldmannii TaxID=192050 RepID=A0A524RNZ2_9CHRO|nr:MAG: TonB family protein [Aphanocapsa feldmannii 277cV]TGH23265.1 MAG: TonB family protein [Aphanocapsa feldmannii 277cI]
MQITQQQWAGAFCTALALHSVLIASMLQSGVQLRANSSTPYIPIRVSFDLHRERAAAGSDLTPQPETVSATAAMDPLPVDAVQEREPPPPSPPVPVEATPVEPAPVEASATTMSPPADGPSSLSKPSDQAQGTIEAAGANHQLTSRWQTPAMPSARDRYVAELASWLAKHKQYPLRARQRRQEGIALLSFVVGRNGQIHRPTIRQSSGSALLDRAVLALLQRAQPLPAIPDQLNQDSLEVVVPVQFRLR